MAYICTCGLFLELSHEAVSPRPALSVYELRSCHLYKNDNIKKTIMTMATTTSTKKYAKAQSRHK
eukprot:3918500-Amphidinium_carterae.1